MNVLMYPLGPEDDFPDEFCAIRQGSGEHWFYTPVGEDASWMLFRALADNAKLRELVRDMNKWLWNGADCTECPFTAECDLNAAFESDLHSHVCIGWSKIHDRMRELGVDA